MTSKTLSVDKIKMDTQKFQFREVRYDPNHVNELVNAIKRGDTLDPMTVWKSPSDGEYYVLAGHHRLRALRRVNKNTEVRVKVFDGDLREGWCREVCGNSRWASPGKFRYDAAQAASSRIAGSSG